VGLAGFTSTTTTSKKKEEKKKNHGKAKKVWNAAAVPAP
jgi:hypothetical protein